MPDPDAIPSSDLSDALADARRYRELGLSAVPVQFGTKSPDFLKMRRITRISRFGFASLSRFRRIPPSEWELCAFFDRPANLALVTDRRHLVVFDFDIPEAFEAWRAAHPEIAAAAPIARTHRGYHVYARSARSMRDSKLSFQGRHCGDVRAHRGWVVAPPSLHSSGSRYRWLDGCAPWDRPLPLIENASDAGLGQYEIQRWWWLAWVILRLLLFFPPSRLIRRIRLRAAKLPIIHAFIGRRDRSKGMLTSGDGSRTALIRHTEST
jgi:hypothetical protein